MFYFPHKTSFLIISQKKLSSVLRQLPFRYNQQYDSFNNDCYIPTVVDTVVTAAVVSTYYI